MIQDMHFSGEPATEARYLTIAQKNPTSWFGRFSDTWSSEIAGQINNMQMQFRHRDEIINEGEFTVMPHGVEHCPVALNDFCEEMLLEPSTIVNTGAAKDERTVTALGHIRGNLSV